MDVEIRPKADRETPERIESADDGGMSGYRCYLARTTDVAAAHAAAALTLPIGSAWSESMPALTLRSRSVRYMGGVDDPASARRGVCLIDCVYSTPRGGRLPVPVAPNVAFTTWQKQNTQTTIFYSPQDPEATFLPITYGYKINNGDGAPRNVTIRSALVTVYKPNLTIEFIRSATQIEDYLNANAVTLPKLDGVGPQLEFQPGELLSMGTTYEKEGDLWKVQTEFAVSPNGFDYLWQAIDDEGVATGPVIRSPLYLKKNFPAELLQ